MEFDELDAGDYTVKVWASNGGEVSGVGKNSVEVVAGESASCEITMRKAYSASAAASYIQELDGGDEYNVIVAGPVDDNAIAGIKSALAKKNNMNGTVALDLSWTTGLKEFAYVEYNDNTSLGAFDECARLSSVILPEGMTAIGGKAFYNCTSLTSVVLPEGITTIGYAAFSGCSALASVTIPYGITKIDEWAFTSTPLTSIEIPNSVTTIGKGAFYGCNLKSIEIPDSVTEIGSQAFDGCTLLESITIPDNVKLIGSDAFSYSGIISITIPSKVTTISNSLLSSCESLESVIIMGETVTIEKMAFKNCKKLKTMTFLGKVEGTIGNDAFYCTGSRAVNKLTVNYGGNQENWNNIDFGTGNDLLKNAATINP